MSNQHRDADTPPPLDAPARDVSEGFLSSEDQDRAGRPSIDVTVGRSAADYLHLVPLDADVAPESALLHPVLSDFARELFERIELANSRVVDETKHLDAVARVSEDYRSAGRPKLHLLP